MSIYSIRLYPEPNPYGQFNVTSPDVPGPVTEGDTPATIQVNAQEALDALQEAWAELNLPIPPAVRPLAGNRPQTV